MNKRGLIKSVFISTAIVIVSLFFEYIWKTDNKLLFYLILFVSVFATSYVYEKIDKNEG